jgi:hypothetical protein
MDFRMAAFQLISPPEVCKHSLSPPCQLHAQPFTLLSVQVTCKPHECFSSCKAQYFNILNWFSSLVPACIFSDALLNALGSNLLACRRTNARTHVRDGAGKDVWSKQTLNDWARGLMISCMDGSMRASMGGSRGGCADRWMWAGCVSA